MKTDRITAVSQETIALFQQLSQNSREYAQYKLVTQTVNI